LAKEISGRFELKMEKKPREFWLNPKTLSITRRRDPNVQLHMIEYWAYELALNRPRKNRQAIEEITRLEAVEDKLRNVLEKARVWVSELGNHPYNRAADRFLTEIDSVLAETKPQVP
jgi:hypothetical protein